MQGMWRRLVEFFRDFPVRFRRKVSQGEYRAEIDGLRFYAIAFVILGHALERAERFFPSFQNAVSAVHLDGHLEIAPAGVFLFFAVSGYVLTTQALKAKADPLSAGFLKRYFGRRILRIEPPYIILLVATWALLSFSGWTPDNTRRFFVEPQSLNLSLLGSVFYLHGLIWGTFPRLFPPGWSLEVEVQFYVLAPLLFAAWAALRAGWARALFTALVLAAGINVTLLGFDVLNPSHLYYSLAHNINYFWIGIAMAYAREPLTVWLARAPAAGVTALGWLGLGGLIVASGPGELPGAVGLATQLLAMYASLAAMFASAFDPRSGFRRFCAAGWISLIGGACYSIYLVHMQIVQTVFVAAVKAAPHLPFAGVVVLFPLSALAAVAIGLTYYVQVERRFMAPDWPQKFAATLRGWRRRRTGATDQAAFP
jgi:peptidoglycan/LPS O-acetylase OafA/YrhL